MPLMNAQALFFPFYLPELCKATLRTIVHQIFLENINKLPYGYPPSPPT